MKASGIAREDIGEIVFVGRGLDLPPPHTIAMLLESLSLLRERAFLCQEGDLSLSGEREGLSLSPKGERERASPEIGLLFCCKVKKTSRQIFL